MNEGRSRITQAFERKLSRHPMPVRLRGEAVHRAIHTDGHAETPGQRWALSLVAALLAVAIVATLVFTARALHPRGSLPAGPPSPAIPWLPLPADLMPPPAPSPQPIPIPPGTPACTADKIVGSVVGSQGATGHVITSFAFAGAGQVACFLDGTPSVTLIDAAGRTIAFRPHAPYIPPSTSGPALVDPGPVPEAHTALKYGQASFNIDWVSQPEGCPGAASVSVATARIALPAGGTLSVAVPAAPAAYVCQGLGVGSFESPPAPVEVTPAPLLPAVTVQARPTAAVGKPFEYMVKLTNDTGQSMNLAAMCPNYEEELFVDIINGSPPLGGKHFFQLNCGPAGTITPGHSATFHMVLEVPASAAPGTYTLIFLLGYWNSMTKVVQTTVKVTVNG